MFQGLFENYLKIVILIKSKNVDTKLEVNVDDYQLLQTRRKFKMMIRQEVEEVLNHRKWFHFSLLSVALFSMLSSCF